MRAERGSKHLAEVPVFARNDVKKLSRLETQKDERTPQPTLPVSTGTAQTGQPQSTRKLSRAWRLEPHNWRLKQRAYARRSRVMSRSNAL